VTVFEASNTELKEFFLCVSGATLSEVMKEHCDHPPATIAHWKKNQGVFYGEVESLPDERLAREFLEQYRGILARTGWKVLP